MARAYRQGQFKPKNPRKYKGDPTKIVFRSSWEKIVFIYLDNKESIIEWSSEELVIPYVSIDGEVHRYFPDILFKVRMEDGSTKTVLAEIKPYEQTIPPKPSKGKSKKTLLEQVCTYNVNMAKWDAAEKYCKKMGWDFIKLTEYDIGIKKRT